MAPRATASARAIAGGLTVPHPLRGEPPLRQMIWGQRVSSYVQCMALLPRRTSADGYPYCLDVGATACNTTGAHHTARTRRAAPCQPATGAPGGADAPRSRRATPRAPGTAQADAPDPGSLCPAGVRPEAAAPAPLTQQALALRTLNPKP